MSAVDPSREHDTSSGAQGGDRDRDRERDRERDRDRGWKRPPPEEFDPLTDPMAPPREPCECYCLHCERVFMSNQMWFQRVINDPGNFPGFWMCPTPNCDGAGYLFDIFPIDPSHPDNDGWHSIDDEDSEYDPEFDDDEDFEAYFDDEGDELPAGLRGRDRGEEPQYDPDEPKYKAMDEEFGGEEYLCEEDYAGEEWKLGLAPGERPPDPQWLIDSRQQWEQEQKKYDEPDQRPRVLDWKDREDRESLDPQDRPFNEDDIPF